MTAHVALAIIGAGPTGLGAAWRLHELGATDWLLVDRATQPGGLAASCTDDRGFVWDIGGHVLFSHYDYFDHLMDDLLGDQWVRHQREAWCYLRNRWVPYPFQNNLWRLPPREVLACLDGLLEVHVRQGGAEAPSDFRGWLLASFGQGLCDTFMFPYNRKVWAYDPARLGTEWMGERVALVDLRRVLRNLVLQEDDVSWGPNSTFRFPLHGGTGAIWQALWRRLPAQRLALGRGVAGVDATNHRLTFSDGASVEYDHLISTMPMDQLLLALSDQPGLMGMANQFVYSSTHVVGAGFDGPVPALLASKCWMYFPEDNCPFYRVTVFSNYSPNNVARPGRQWSLMGEVSQSPEKPVDADSVVEQVVAGFEATGLMPPGTPIISRWHQRVEYGYPTPWKGRDVLLGRVDGELKKLDIYSRGRFGGWRYEVSNQDHCLMQGVEVVEHLLNGAPEVTYYQPGVVNARRYAGPGSR